MLSDLHSIFDPLRLTILFLLCSKLVYQTCIMSFPKLTWENPLFPVIVGKWKYFIRQLTGLRKLRIQGWYTGLATQSEVTILVFCDASTQAYRVVTYITNEPGHSTSFIIAESRVVPWYDESWSFPRKELIAFLEGGTDHSALTEAFEDRFTQLVVSTDSMIVLSWMNNDMIKPCWNKP